MNVRNLVLVVVLIVVALLALGCGAAATPPPPTPTPTLHPGETLVNSRCSTCHPIGLVENSKFSAQGWQIVVERMVMAGASLNSDQQMQVVDYLAVRFPKD